MKILEQLKKLAERKQRQLRQSESKRKAKEWQYHQGPGKKIIQLHDYLREFVEYLTIAELKIPASYTIPNTTVRARFIQKEYLIRLDSIHAPTWISLTFRCHRKLPLGFSIENQEQAENTARILQERGITFEQSPIFGFQRKTVGFNFEIVPIIPVALRIQANKDAGLIGLYSQNFEGLSLQRDSIHPENITEDWLDRFGRYILRQNVTYRYNPVTNEERNAIKKSIAQVKRKLTLVDHGFEFLLERGGSSNW
jgi:hypothetical protein